MSTNNEYEQTGYPLGLRVMSEAHSYGVSYAEDILFVTVKVRNESGDWCAEDENFDPILDENGQQKCGEAMIMPDGTKLNRGKGFDYSGVSLGFWMDGVILSNDEYGDYGYWTSAEDFMKYYWEFFEVNNERMSISMAMIGDYDGMSLVLFMPWTQIHKVPARSLVLLQPSFLIHQRRLIQLTLIRME